MSWRGFIAGLIVAFASTTAGADTLDAGRTAYMQGEYARSFQILKPLAEKGDATAAYIVGRQYQLGQGVARDLGQAWYWYRRAEAKGNIEAALFRKLLVSKWKISAADRARGDAKYAAFRRGGHTPTTTARITMRPSPKPTPAVAPPSNPKPVNVSELPRIRIAPDPQPADRKATGPDRASKQTDRAKTGEPANQPVTTRARTTCIWCQSNDTEPRLADRTPQTARRPEVTRGDNRDNDWDEREGSAPAIAPAPRRPGWREEPAYVPPPAVRYRGRGYWRFRGWYRPGWRARARWRRFGPGALIRRWGFYRRWRRY